MKVRFVYDFIIRNIIIWMMPDKPFYSRIKRRLASLPLRFNISSQRPGNELSAVS